MPSGLGLGTATTSAVFFPHSEHHRRNAKVSSVVDQPNRRARASGSMWRETPTNAHFPCLRRLASEPPRRSRLAKKQHSARLRDHSGAAKRPFQLPALEVHFPGCQRLRQHPNRLLDLLAHKLVCGRA
jgi:hypothetical protein